VHPKIGRRKIIKIENKVVEKQRLSKIEILAERER
jgi:aspartate carbamoyltransferase regulatory subunit